MGKADMIEEEPKNLIVKIYRVLDKYIKNSSLQQGVLFFELNISLITKFRSSYFMLEDYLLHIELL
ncbi:hypothetical protein ACGO3R_13970 [Lactococcus lactis]